MKCPICDTRIPVYADRCPDCGYHTPEQPRYTAEPEPQTKPRRRGCRSVFLVLTAVLLFPIAASLLGMGLAQFAQREEVSFYPEDEIIASVPREDSHIPSAVYEDCFAVAEHTLTFLPEKWDGGPILEIPAYVDGEVVTTIAPGCFRDCAGLTTILLPDSITAIGPEAFAGCRDLRGLYLPEGTESIGRGAFRGCINMEAIHIPSTVNFVGTGAFDDCASLIYLFYNGEFEVWRALCNEFINPFTTAICIDGNYYHGVQG